MLASAGASALKGFQKGNKHGRGGKREGAGAKKQSEIEAQETAETIIQNLLQANARKLGNRYIERALGEGGDRVLCHVMDKVLPEIKTDAANRPIAIQIIIESAGQAAAGTKSPRDSGPVLTIGD